MYTNQLLALYCYPKPAAGTVLLPKPIRLRANMPVKHNPINKTLG